MKEYEVEEQGLRVMLEEAVDERTKSEVSQIKQVLRQWELLLFGRQQPVSDFYQAAERNMESFIEVRWVKDFRGGKKKIFRYKIAYWLYMKNL